MSLEVRNPRSGAADYSIEPYSRERIGTCSAALRQAQQGWAQRKAEERAEILERWAIAIEHHVDQIADALTIDTGRRGISCMEVTGLARLIKRWADAAPRLIMETQGGARATSMPGVSTKTQLVPYPVVGVISPWNFPLTLALIDAIPALAAGCAVMVKPSEVTPRFIRPLKESIDDVPELAEVIALIEGDGQSGAAIIDHVDFICFTGSVPTGRKVAEAAARAMIPASLELGGKDPMIVLASADPAKAAAVALRASIVNSGQACQSIERIYVAREIGAQFLEALLEQTQQVRLNSDDVGAGEIGPFISARQSEIVAAQIKDARDKGAHILCGGEIEEHGGGLYLRPTIITGITPDMEVMRQETFGPVLPVILFESVDEAIALANGSEFGLSAAVLAGSQGEAEQVAGRLEAGAVSINDGALTSMVWEAEKTSFKLSGLGPSRMGESGLLRFFRRRALILQGGDPLPIGAYSEETLGR